MKLLILIVLALPALPATLFSSFGPGMSINTGASPTDVVNNYYPAAAFNVAVPTTINFITLALTERNTTPTVDLGVSILGSSPVVPFGPDLAQSFYSGTVLASSLSVGTSSNITLSPSGLVLAAGQYWIALRPNGVLGSTPNLGIGSYGWSAAGVSSFGIALDLGNGYQIYSGAPGPAFLVDGTAVTSGVPEPSSLSLLLLPILGLALRRQSLISQANSLCSGWPWPPGLLFG